MEKLNYHELSELNEILNSLYGIKVVHSNACMFMRQMFRGETGANLIQELSLRPEKLKKLTDLRPSLLELNDLEDMMISNKQLYSHHFKLIKLRAEIRREISDYLADCGIFLMGPDEFDYDKLIIHHNIVTE